MDLKTAAAVSARTEAEQQAARDAARQALEQAKDTRHIEIVKMAARDHLQKFMTSLGATSVTISDLRFGWIFLGRTGRYVSLRFAFELDGYQFRGYARGGWIFGEEIEASRVEVKFRSIYDESGSNIYSGESLSKSLARYDRWHKRPRSIRWLGRYF